MVEFKIFTNISRDVVNYRRSRATRIFEKIVRRRYKTTYFNRLRENEFEPSSARLTESKEKKPHEQTIINSSVSSDVIT